MDCSLNKNGLSIERMHSRQSTSIRSSLILQVRVQQLVSRAFDSAPSPISPREQDNAQSSSTFHRPNIHMTDLTCVPSLAMDDLKAHSIAGSQMTRHIGLSRARRTVQTGSWGPEVGEPNAELLFVLERLRA